MRVRAGTTADIPALLNLERECATAAHWSEPQYRAALRTEESGDSERVLLVIDRDAEASSFGQTVDSQLLGFLVAHHLGPEWELENIVVAPSARRKGLASRLLGELLARAREAGGESVFLEVRESNLAARAVYERKGFTETGRRARYYASPSEGAILYRMKLAGLDSQDEATPS